MKHEFVRVSNFGINKIYITCIRYQRNDVEYIRIVYDFYDSTTTCKVYSTSCRECSKKFFDAKTSEIILTILRIGGWDAVGEYMKICLESI